MPDANGQFKGISIPDCAYTRSLEAMTNAELHAELKRLSDGKDDAAPAIREAVKRVTRRSRV